jgi:hypothetical protein
MIYFKKPRNKTIVAYLKSNGWQLEKTGEVYFHMRPPKDMAFDDKDFQYLVPVYEDARGYDEFTFGVVRSISELYEVKFQELLDLFSQSLEEIKSDVEAQPRQLEVKRAMLAGG